MVYYFTSNVVDPPGFIYVGKDKYENEDLIKYGWDEDVWYVRSTPSSARKLPFHVDKLSSAHIYLRMKEGEQWDNLPEDLVMDLAQLTKANSIEGQFLPAQVFRMQPALIQKSPGNKKDNITVIYTPWSNLKKDGSMDVGQVTFKDQRKVSQPPRRLPRRLELIHSRSSTHTQVKRILVPQRENPIVNRLNKTRVEKKPDLKQEKDDRQRELRKRQQAALQQRKKEEARQAQEWKEKKWQKDHAYDDIFTEENMAASSNQARSEDWEDDFM
ncbi:Coiled-coil domain-containing protein-like protein [Hapsidospora chrysogenum ATCC 11550]|uniref:Coiled-coil domain-containing protein-like protein n=1 Tax=Hapsidospora chrysogenum (strain ATCC 11550 / CBS 779.69 / DSM 880 / IAM 14645 / JCM 23072 / IMI 49137) TaxID=857340 RepID=A0A086SVA4_HAPC1|nr:Coiled-coil domain-containing protein-like protein [Hapsidospora chrysogenum ATCC 11550]